MIATAFRSKLPKSLSYPVGAEALSEGLAGAPHLDALRLSFYSHPVEPASRFQRVLAERQPYPIVVAEYHPARRPGLSAAGFMIDRGWYDERWELTVYPVLREYRQSAHRLLIGQGLAGLAGWLGGAVAAARGVTVQRAELVFSPAEAALTMSESGRPERSRV